MTLRIAMWSGPRNISTAMMRVFENRPDCAVSDEPFYAHYLAATGIDHPMREAVMATQPTDWRQVVAAITGPAPGGAPLWYQKHMTHHMIPAVGRGWFDRVLHAFLIRDPRAIAASYAAKREGTNAADLGAQLQAELYDAVVAATGREPPVIDADDVLASRGARPHGQHRRAARSPSPSTPRCCPGPPVRATATVSGANTGMPASGPRPVSVRRRSRRSCCPRSSRRWRRPACRSTNACTSAGWDAEA